MPMCAHMLVGRILTLSTSTSSHPMSSTGLSSMQLARCGSGTHRYSEEARPAAEVFDRLHQVNKCRRPRAKMCGPVCPSSTPSHRRRCRRSRPAIFSAPAHLRRRSPRPPCEPFATSTKPHQKMRPRLKSEEQGSRTGLRLLALSSAVSLATLLRVYVNLMRRRQPRGVTR